MLNTRRCLTRPEACETKHRLHDSGVAQFDRFFGQCDTEPVGAFSRETLCASDGAVSVRVRFDNSHDARGGTDTLLDLMKVGGELVEIDLRPRRAAGAVVLL